MNQMDTIKKGDKVATVTTTMGVMKFRLFPDAAPKAVENFATHAANGYYNDLIFHRVIRDFMIQGGDPQGTGMGGKSIWGSSFEDEFSADAHNYYGALSMANAGPNTNGSQFFIVQAKEVPPSMLEQMETLKDQGFAEEVIAAYKEVGGTPWLDFKHTVFGQLAEGAEVLEAIAAVACGFQDKPVEDVVIKSIVIEDI